MGSGDLVVVGLGVALVAGLCAYAIEKGKVRGEEVVYTSIFHGSGVEVVEQDRKWVMNRCFIRSAGLRLDVGELVTDDGKLVSIGFANACSDCYCVRDYQPNNTSEE